MDLGDVAAGLYPLRIDQLAADGRVASRVETPFQRDFPRAPLPRPGVAGARATLPGAITVQPGHNLWTLARLHYGSGVLYTQIFTANRELIRDPDLIYPGQIFDLPEAGRGPSSGRRPIARARPTTLRRERLAHRPPGRARSSGREDDAGSSPARGRGDGRARPRQARDGGDAVASSRRRSTALAPRRGAARRPATWSPPGRWR